MVSQNLYIVLVLCIISLCACYILNNNQLEAFGCNCGSPKCGACSTSQTAPVGTPRCDLKGQLLRTRPIDDCKCHPYANCYNSNPYQFPIKHIN